MSFHKLLSKSGNLLARNVLPFKKSTGEMTTRSLLLYAPPEVKLSTGERIVMGLIISFSFLAIPTWVIYHIPEYQGLDRSTWKKKE